MCPGWWRTSRNHLKSFDTFNAGLVVIRYFGGTEVGKAGLIEVYGHTVKRCLTKAKLQPVELVWETEIIYPYSKQNSVDQLKHQFRLEEISAEYLEKITMVLACPEENRILLSAALKQRKHRGITYVFSIIISPRLHL